MFASLAPLLMPWLWLTRTWAGGSAWQLGISVAIFVQRDAGTISVWSFKM